MPDLPTQLIPGIQIQERPPALPLLVTSFFVSVIGISYWFLHLPNSLIILTVSLILSAILFFARYDLPSFVYPNHPNWIPKVIIPFIGFATALLYYKSGLRGGIFVSTGIVIGSFGLSILLTTNLIFAIRQSVRAPLIRLLPLSAILAAIVCTALLYFTGNKVTGLIVCAFILLAIPVAVIVHRFLHYSLLSFTTLCLAAWPAIILPKGSWYVEAFGPILIVCAFIRNAKSDNKSFFPATAIYVVSGLYLIWNIVALVFSPIPDSVSAFKIFSIVGQVLFLFGILENLRTRSDLYAVIFGFLVGTAIILVIMLQSTWHQITHIDPLRFFVYGIRATVGDQNANNAVIPILGGALLTLAIAIKVRGFAQYVSIIFSLLCIGVILLSGSRSAEVALFGGGLIMTAKYPKWRRILLTSTLLLLVAIGIAYLVNPTATKILTRTRRLDSGRLLLWQTAWNLTLKHPFVGYGPNTSKDLLPLFVASYSASGIFWKGGKAHNALISEGFESGLIGMALLILIYIFMWRFIIKIPDREDSPWKLAAIGLFVGYILRSFFETSGFLFVQSSLGDCYQSLLALIIVTGEILPNDKRDWKKLLTGEQV